MRSKQAMVRDKFRKPLSKRVFGKILYGGLRKMFFPGSINYWEKRYASGGTSGRGSYGKLAIYKARFINSFIKKNKIRSIVEFGCGDGNQLKLAEYPKYIGLDVSKTAIEKCVRIFKNDASKSFFLYDPECFMDTGNIFKCDLALSLDVIFHLVEDDLFEKHMRHLFLSTDKFVIIYSSNTKVNSLSKGIHVRHREFTKWIDKNITDWELSEKVINKYPQSEDGQHGSFSDFYVYKKT